MKLIIRDAKKGVVASWYLADEDTLVVRVAKDLDEVSKQRYITQAKREKGFVEERRRRMIPMIIPGAGSLRRAVSEHKPAAIGVAVAAAAVTVTAAVVTPMALHIHDGAQDAHPHTQAAPAPQPSRPRTSSPPSSAPPTNRSTPNPTLPSQPGVKTPGKTPPTHTDRATRHHGKPSRNPVGHVLPTLPSIPSGDLPVTSPSSSPTHARICLELHLLAYIRLGCRHP